MTSTDHDTCRALAAWLGRTPEEDGMGKTFEALEKLAASFDARSERALSGVDYTRSGYMTRDSVGLQGMAVAFETAARELRALLTDPDARQQQRRADGAGEADR